MKTIKIYKTYDIPENYTGIAEWSDGTKVWLLNGKQHRENGPVFEFLDGTKEYYLNDKRLNKDKINQFIDEFGYSVEVAIKLTYLLRHKK